MMDSPLLSQPRLRAHADLGCGGGQARWRLRRRLLGGMEVSEAGQAVIDWISTIQRSSGGALDVYSWGKSRRNPSLGTETAMAMHVCRPFMKELSR
jgi:hypothetical protein